MLSIFSTGDQQPAARDKLLPDAWRLKSWKFDEAVTVEVEKKEGVRDLDSFVFNLTLHHEKLKEGSILTVFQSRTPNWYDRFAGFKTTLH